MPQQRSAGRGRFLTIMIFFSLIFQVVTPQSVIQDLTRPYIFQSLLSHSKSIIAVGFFLEFIPGIFLILWSFIFTGIWQWKKMAAYASFLFIGANLILSSILLHAIFLSKTYHPAFSSTPYIFVPYVLNTFFWFWAIKRKWKFFT